VTFEVSGTEVTITGATSVKCGGGDKLAKHDEVLSVLQKVAAALVKIGPQVMQPTLVADSVTAATGAIADFVTAGTTITKGA
jgi:hypothetical protein